MSKDPYHKGWADATAKWNGQLFAAEENIIRLTREIEGYKKTVNEFIEAIHDVTIKKDEYLSILSDLQEMTNPDDEDSYANDDPHKCLEVIYEKVTEIIR